MGHHGQHSTLTWVGQQVPTQRFEVADAVLGRADLLDQGEPDATQQVEDLRGFQPEPPRFGRLQLLPQRPRPAGAGTDPTRLAST